MLTPTLISSMSCTCKEHGQPVNMTDYFSPPLQCSSQDGGGSTSLTSPLQQSQLEEDALSGCQDDHSYTSSFKVFYLQAPSLTSSPANSKRKISQSQAAAAEVGAQGFSLGDSRELQDFILAFPTT